MPDLGSDLNRMYKQKSPPNSPVIQNTPKQKVGGNVKSHVKDFVEDLIARIKAYSGDALYTYHALLERLENSSQMTQALVYGCFGLLAMGSVFYLYLWICQN